MTILKKFVYTSLIVTGGIKLFLIHTNDEYSDLWYTFQQTFTKNSTTIPTSMKPNIVILGTGWGALSCLSKLDSNKVNITIISPRSYFFYTPLLAGVSTGTVYSTSIMESIRWHLLKYGTMNYIQGECVGINFQKKLVQYSSSHTHASASNILPSIQEDMTNTPLTSISSSNDTHEIPYDHLIIAVGAIPATFGIPGVEDHAIFMKEIENGLTVHNKILEILEQANTLLLTGTNVEIIQQLLHWVIIGGGPTGVELTAELNDFLQNDVKKYFPHLMPYINITLLEATDKILGMFDPKISNYAQKILTQHGAHVLCNSAVTKMTSNTITIKKMIINENTQEKIPHIENINYGIAVWAGGITARPITQQIARSIGNEQIPPNNRPIRGLLVGEKFQVKGLENDPNTRNCVWAIGDCALSGCPPTAQAAFQQGNYLGRMLRDTNLDPRLIEQYPSFVMNSYGAMAYLGASQGVAELKGMLWDRYPVTKQPNENTIVEGTGAFALWRSLYFSRLLSNRNKAHVMFDWIKASIFGRDISSPYVLPPAAPGPPSPSTTNTPLDSAKSNKS